MDCGIKADDEAPFTLNTAVVQEALGGGSVFVRFGQMLVFTWQDGSQDDLAQPKQIDSCHTWLTSET